MHCLLRGIVPTPRMRREHALIRFCRTLTHQQKILISSTAASIAVYTDQRTFQCKEVVRVTGCYFTSWGRGRLTGLGGTRGAAGARRVGEARAQGRAFQEGRGSRAARTHRQARDLVVAAVVLVDYSRDYSGAQRRVASALPRLATSQPDSGSMPPTLGYNSFLSIF